MGCPDAVRAELLKLRGVLAAAYDDAADSFSVRFESVLVTSEAILAAVAAAGKKMARNYTPEVIG